MAFPLLNNRPIRVSFPPNEINIRETLWVTRALAANPLHLQPEWGYGEGIAMNDVASSTEVLIQHVSELPAYSPPAHSGTDNRRLVGREFGAGFEMILGQVAPGGEASRHF